MDGFSARNGTLLLGTRPRILVIKLATLGDMLLTTPAIRALRRRYPEAVIDVLTTAVGASLLTESRLVDHVFTLDKYSFDTPMHVARHPQRLLQTMWLLLNLHRRRYDVALLAHHLTLRFGRLKYRALLKALGARKTVGLDNGHGGFLDIVVKDAGFGALHEAEYTLALAAAVDATLPDGERGLRVEDLGWGDDSSNTPARQEAPKVVALHPGSGGYSVARRWPLSSFAQLARALHRQYGANILLVGGAEEQTLHEELLTALGRPEWAMSVAGIESPRTLAERISHCALLVGNDSFPMHMAAAVGVPVVGIFGPSNAQAWGPYAPDEPERAVIVRRDDLACSPCFYRGHALGTPEGCPPRPCLTELDVASVLQAARRFLGTNPHEAVIAQSSGAH